MILEPKKIKSVTVSTFSPSICHEVIETGGQGNPMCPQKMAKRNCLNRKEMVAEGGSGFQKGMKIIRIDGVNRIFNPFSHEFLTSYFVAEAKVKNCLLWYSVSVREVFNTMIFIMCEG